MLDLVDANAPFHPEPAGYQFPVLDGYIVGVDTSVAQGPIYAQQLIEAGAAFCVAKATDGEHDVDLQWHATAESCTDAQLPLGAYGVLEPYGASRAKGQAQHFVSVVKDYDLATVWLDFELAHGLAGIDALKAAVVWRDTVEDALGRRVMVYTGLSFVETLERYAGSSGYAEELAKSEIAAAQYTGSFARPPTVPKPWKKVTIWQATGNRSVSRNYGRLPWKDVDVDMDLFRGTIEELLALRSG